MDPDINLAVGDPSGAPHPDLVDAYGKAIKEPAANHYASPKGLASTRSSAARYYEGHGVLANPNCITITHGARSGLQFGLAALGRRDRSCGYLDPAYTYFPSIIEGSGMRRVPIHMPEGPLTASELRPHLKGLRGGALLFNNPHNPTGRIFCPDEISAVVEVCKEFDIKILSDAVYIDLYETDRPRSLLSIEPKALEAFSLSKPFRACGYRVGAVVGDPDWVNSFTELYAVMNGVPHATQRVAEFAWSHMPGVEEFRLELVKRRALVVRALRAIGFSVDTETFNRGSMFVWARLPEDSPPAHVVAARCRAHGVLISDGEAFGAGFGRFIRIALNEAEETLATAMSRLIVAMESKHAR
jgi:aspartate/methionine/tyrosine aminotransferase